MNKKGIKSVLVFWAIILFIAGVGFYNLKLLTYVMTIITIVLLIATSYIVYDIFSDN